MNTGAIDLNLLVALDALFAERNVTRAAARLQLSQPALSARLHRLRALLGDPLFVPAARGMTPTAKALVPACSPVSRSTHSSIRASYWRVSRTSSDLLADDWDDFGLIGGLGSLRNFGGWGGVSFAGRLDASIGEGAFGNTITASSAGAATAVSSSIGTLSNS